MVSICGFSYFFLLVNITARFSTVRINIDISIKSILHFPFIPPFDKSPMTYETWGFYFQAIQHRS